MSWGRTVLTKTNEQILRQLYEEGFITEYNLEEKWYKPTLKYDRAVKRRWKQIIQECTDDIRTGHYKIGCR